MPICDCRFECYSFGNQQSTIDNCDLSERKPFLLRVDPAVLQAVQRWADNDLRSLNGQIEYLLKEAVAKRRNAFSEEEGEKGRKGERES